MYGMVWYVIKQLLYAKRKAVKEPKQKLTEALNKVKHLKQVGHNVTNYNKYDDY